MMRRRKDHGAPARGGDVLVRHGAAKPGEKDGVAAEAGADTSGTAPENGLTARPPNGDELAGTDASSSTPRKGLLGEVLVSRGLVTDTQVSLALQLQASSGKRLGEVLVDMEALDERGLVEALADFFEMPVTDLRHDSPEPAALALVPEQMAREHLAIPVHLDRDGLHVAVAQPSDDLRFALATTSGRSVRLRLAPVTDIRWAIDRSYQAIGSVDKLVQAFEAVEGTRKRPSDVDTAPAFTENAPVVQVVDSILTQAVRDRASDVHIEPSEDAIYVRFRIDGALKDVLELPSSMGMGLLSRIKILAGINIVEKRRSQDGQFTSEIDGKGTDIRVATIATIWGEKCVLRILDKNRSVLRLDDLGMPSDTHTTYSRVIRAPFGMVLCAGPTGSGKTTTLYATLGEVTDRARRVRVSEDKPGADQRRCGSDVRQWPQVDPASGSRRDPGRGDPRRGNGADGGAVRAHRAFRPLVGARKRRRLGAPPLPRHGHRIVLDRVVRHRHRRPEARAPHLRAVQDAVHAE